MARKKRKASEVSDVRSSNPAVRAMEGYRGYKSKSGYFIPSAEGYGNPYRKKKVKRKLATASSDVRSDSGYEVKSGKTDAGGVNPRMQGPWANRYKAAQKAKRKRYKRGTNPFD